MDRESKQMLIISFVALFSLSAGLWAGYKIGDSQHWIKLSPSR